MEDKEYYKQRSRVLRERKKIAAQREKELRQNATWAELVFKRKLEKLGYEFIFQKAFYDNFYFCIADFYLPKIKLIIEVDGRYHCTKQQREKDKKHEQFLNRLGYKVVRFTNTQAIRWGVKRINSRLSVIGHTIK